MALPLPFPTYGKIMRDTQQGSKRDLWIPSSFDYDIFEDKFWGDALLGEYPAAKTNGTSAAVTFTEHNEGGFLELVSGTTDDGYAGQGLGLQFTGTRGILFEALIKLPAAITTMKFEIGLSDADDDAGAVNVKSTPSFTASDCAVLVFDTDDDANWAFATYDGTTAKATQDISAVPAPAVSTVYSVAIQVRGVAASAYVNGIQVGGHPAAVTKANKLTPWVFVQARAGSASRTLQLIKWRVIQPAHTIYGSY